LDPKVVNFNETAASDTGVSEDGQPQKKGRYRMKHLLFGYRGQQSGTAL
jgi:hypothetical protein